MSNKTRVIIVGSKGRMGEALMRLGAADPALELIGGVDRGDDLQTIVDRCDVLIEFAHHSATPELLDLALARNKSLVIGTTGHTAEERAKITAAATKLPIVFAPNYSVGVNVLFYLTQIAAETLGESFDQEVIEMHHHHKLDAPSGTARRLGEILAQAAGGTYDELVRHGRAGDVGARPKKEIGMHALRGGDVVGDHTVVFAANGERVELTHKASCRDTFAGGALRAAAWVRTQKPGLYSMQDVLGFGKSKPMHLEISTSHTDAVNARILAVSEDRIQGFVRDPMGEIARRCQLPVETVIERIRAMLRGGTIRRVRQTLMATDLAPGALVAWEIDADKLDAAFDFMSQQDPFSGHVVIRSTDTPVSGSQYKLWTTLKVPHGFSMPKHADYLRDRVGARSYRLMPAKGIFALGVGHTRRSSMEPGAKADEPAEMHTVRQVKLGELEWRVLTSLKREFEPEEIVENIWDARAREADLPLPTFLEIAESLNQRKVIGRFSTFLEHVKPTATGERVTRFNALFHWAVPPGRELEAGREIGRHHILTHCYWREGGPEFKDVNIMAVAHGTDRDRVRAHKEAIDTHLREIGLPFSYTNVFWGGRSEIKPSEISPTAYADWCRASGINPDAMRG